jgi:hypothetical protein
MFIVSNISGISKGGATIPMTTRMRSTTSAAPGVSLFHHRQFSSSSSSNQDNDGAGDGPLPLFLVLNSRTNNDLTTSTVRRPKLLLPPLAVAAATTTATTVVTTIEDVLDAVNRHYSAENDDNDKQQQQQFVGGMGESDPGVWFITTAASANNNENDNDDPLDHAEFVTDSILAVKEHRHGVPFGLYTTGIVDSSDDMVMSCLQRLKTLHVGLYAATPPDYSKATGLAMPEAQVAFGRACSFLAMVGENKGKLTLQVGLAKSLNSSAAKAGRDLALSLGAQQVYYY